jgi:hypothetical protein
MNVRVIFKKVAKYHNEVNNPILDIELNYVTPPYLHILLGIVQKHHKLLESAADEIDLLIFESVNEQNIDNNINRVFKKYGKNWKQVIDLNERIESLEDSIAESEEEHQIYLKTKLEEVTGKLNKLQFVSLDERSGPVCMSLGTVLNKHKITPPVYHSRSFVGNHSHKYLDKVKRNYYTNIMSYTESTNH